jgi:hypothetical protein
LCSPPRVQTASPCVYRPPYRPETLIVYPVTSWGRKERAPSPQLVVLEAFSRGVTCLLLWSGDCSVALGLPVLAGR